MTNYTLNQEQPEKNDVCRLCEIGHRRQDKNHIASQSKGMIPTIPCTAVKTVHLGAATESNARPWIVYCNGQRVMAGKRIARFSSSTRAEMAGWLTVKKYWPGV